MPKKYKKKPTRSSSKFTFNVGYILILLVVFLVVFGSVNGLINSNNLVDIMWCLLISAASFLGVNLARVAFENVAKINNGISTDPPAPIEDETPKMDVKIEDSTEIK